MLVLYYFLNLRVFHKASKEMEKSRKIEEKMYSDPHETWRKCLSAIEKKIKHQSFETWFRTTNCCRFDEEIVEIEVPSAFFRDFLEENYFDIISSTIREESSVSPEITFSIVENDMRGPPSFSHAGSSPSEDGQASPILMGTLNSKYTFDKFVVGTGNEFAHAASVAVAEAPGDNPFNPLVIYGGVGLGKTHILQAIADFCVWQATVQNIIYVSSEQFFTEFINSMKERRTADFAKRYRTADILLVDDVQFFLRTESIQRELFHTFNALHQNGKQIVLTSDCPPNRLKSMEERLISRFQWGLVTSIEPPDLETRIAILKKKADDQSIAISDEIASFIAKNVSSNIRELEGCLVKILAYSSLNNRSISLEMVKRIVEPSIHASDLGVTVEVIQRKSCKYYQVPQDVMIGKSRKQDVAAARQIAMYLSKSLTRMTLKNIGLHFGGRDHTTVLHACQRIRSRIEAEQKFSEEIKALSDSIVVEAASQNIPPYSH